VSERRLFKLNVLLLLLLLLLLKLHDIMAIPDYKVRIAWYGCNCQL